MSILSVTFAADGVDFNLHDKTRRRSDAAVVAEKMINFYCCFCISLPLPSPRWWWCTNFFATDTARVLLLLRHIIRLSVFNIGPRKYIYSRRRPLCAIHTTLLLCVPHLSHHTTRRISHNILSSHLAIEAIQTATTPIHPGSAEADNIVISVPVRGLCCWGRSWLIINCVAIFHHIDHPTENYSETVVPHRVVVVWKCGGG